PLLDLFAGDGIPDADFAERRGRGKQLAVRRNRHGGDRRVVADILIQLLARSQVPPADGVVQAGGGEELLVLRQRHGVAVAGVALDPPYFASLLGVPYPNGL